MPIYVDPIVTLGQGADPKGKAFATIAPIEIDDLPLRVALRLVLDQFSLSYQVRDRMVYVIDEQLLDFRTLRRRGRIPCRQRHASPGS